jgi:cytoskeletal protein RodZ
LKGSKVIILILVVLGILLLLFVALIMVAILVALLFWPRQIQNNNPTKPTVVNAPVAVGEFKEFSYSPGYGDMNGTSIHETLRIP